MHESNFVAFSTLDHTREVSPHEMANAIRVLAMDAGAGRQWPFYLLSTKTPVVLGGMVKPPVARSY